MATIPHGVEQERATVPRIVLPITRRGLVVTDGLCWAILGAAMVAAAGLILYLNRGTTFFLDELVWVYQSPGLGNPGDVVEPHNGHLIATTRLVYKAILETFGAEYVVFRVLAVATVLGSAGLFYTLVMRRIGALPALAPTFVLLLLGSAWQHVGLPIGFTIVFSVAAGLAALLALERGDRRGDVAACGLTTLSVATYTTGLGFLAGVAVSVLLRADRARRAWIFLIPLALYAAWWLWSLSQPSNAGQVTTVSNALLIPNYVADSLAAVAAAVAGLSFDFNAPTTLGISWGRILAVLGTVALALRIRRGAVPPMVWVALAIVITYWALGALATSPLFDRVPQSQRYIYLGSVGVLLAAAAAVPPIRFSRLGLVALFAACAFSLATNIALLRDGAASIRSGYATPAQAELAMLELARGDVDPGFDPFADGPGGGLIESPAATYLAAVDRYGSPAFSLTELEGQAESVRQEADRTLAGALDLRLEASPSGLPPRGCQTFSSDAPGGATGFELPPGGAILRARGVAPMAVTLGRFGPPSAEIGRLAPGEPAALRITVDPSSKPWLASISGADSVEVCPLG
jgi:hypothetical protein